MITRNRTRFHDTSAMQSPFRGVGKQLLEKFLHLLLIQDLLGINFMECPDVLLRDLELLKQTKGFVIEHKAPGFEIA